MHSYAPAAGTLYIEWCCATLLRDRARTPLPCSLLPFLGMDCQKGSSFGSGWAKCHCEAVPPCRRSRARFAIVMSGWQLMYSASGHRASALLGPWLRRSAMASQHGIHKTAEHIVWILFKAHLLGCSHLR